MKSSPNLPASSRMQMASGGGSMPKGKVAPKKGATKKVMSGAKGAGMKKKSC